MRKTLFFQKKIKLFNVEFMVTHVNAQTEDNLTLFEDFSIRKNATLTLCGMDNNIKQATAHKPVEMFLKFATVLLSGARSRCNFLAMANNLKLTKINGGTNMTTKIIKNIG